MLQGKCLVVVYCFSHHCCLWGSPHPHVSPLLVFGPARPPWTGKGAVLLVVGGVVGWVCVCVWLLLFDLPFRSGKSRMSGCTESQKTGKRCLFLFCHYSQVLRPVHWVFCVVNWGAYFFFWIAFCLISAYTQTNFPLRQNAIFVFIHLEFNCFHSVDAAKATANQHPQCSGKTSHESQATYCLLIWELYIHICP